ncbi:MAG: head GIN domain-containing protein [Inhella sp.]|jgi:hypothetical protein
MRRLVALLVLLACAGVHAEEQEWVLRIKKEAHNVAFNLSSNTVYGSGAQRTKGSGNVVEKARNVASFSRVRLDGPVDAKLVPSSGAEAVRVSADDNIEPMVTTVVEGDTLVIGIKPGSSFSTRQPVRVLVDFKQLQALQLRGSGDAQVEQLKGDRFQIDLSSSGDVSIGLLEVRELVARLSGSGDLQVAGRAELQDWDLSGSGDASAASLSGAKARARLSGSGDLRLGVSQELDATLSGSGDLTYSGRPKLQSKVSGSGELINR